MLIGFSVNVIGNSLTIVSNEGAEPWTAAAVNVSKLTGASVGSFIIIFGVFMAVFNQFLLSRRDRYKLYDFQEYRWDKHKDDIPYYDWPKEAGRDVTERIIHTFINKFRFLAEIMYIFIFGYTVDWMNLIFTKLGLSKLGTPWRIVMSLVGVTLFCSAISIYQRANLFMHPNDDTSNIIRFMFLGGSAFKSQIVDIIPAMLICLVCWPLLGAVFSVSWGTIYSVLFNGVIVGVSDKLIWPKLVHNHQTKHTYHFSIWY